MNASKSRLGSSSLLVAMALCLATAGCAANKRQAFLQDKARNHVYRKPVAEVWPQALALIKEEGYSLRAGKEGFEASTEWLMLGAPSSLGTTYCRYLVRGVEKGPGQSSIEYWKQLSNEARGADNTTGHAKELNEAAPRTDTGNFNRDPEMEWKLLERVDAEEAKTLSAEADKQP